MIKMVKKNRFRENPELITIILIFFKKGYNNDITTGNGFIEGEELDDFLREFITSLSSDNIEVNF